MSEGIKWTAGVHGSLNAVLETVADVLSVCSASNLEDWIIGQTDFGWLRGQGHRNGLCGPSVAPKCTEGGGVLTEASAPRSFHPYQGD